MSAEAVQANYDELDAVAGRFSKRAELVVELSGRVTRGVQALEDGGWQGAGALNL